MLFTGLTGFTWNGNDAGAGGPFQPSAYSPGGSTSFPLLVNDTVKVKQSEPTGNVLLKEEEENKLPWPINTHTREAIEEYNRNFQQEISFLKNKQLSSFAVVEGILKKCGLPGELKYLAYIESNLQSNATSKAGAVGLWQLMPSTARYLGLRITKGVDERRDMVKSTMAASKLLQESYNEFKDWLLVMAAYNCGAGRVKTAIRKSGSDNYWDLQHLLPLETRKHVKKYISLHYALEGSLGVTTLTRAEADAVMQNLARQQAEQPLTQEELQQAQTHWLSGKYCSKAIAPALAMDWGEFNRYNPGFDKLIASSENRYALRLPADKMELFLQKKFDILQRSMELLMNGDPAAPASN